MVTPVLRNEPGLFNRIKLTRLELDSITQKCEESGTLEPQSRLAGDLKNRVLGAQCDCRGNGAALDGATGKILGKLAVPFTGLGSHGAVSGGSLFRCAAQIKTLVRLH